MLDSFRERYKMSTSTTQTEINMTYQFVECVKELTPTPVVVTKTAFEVSNELDELTKHKNPASDEEFGTHLWHLCHNLEQDIWNADVCLYNYATTDHSFYLQNAIDLVNQGKKHLQQINEVRNAK